VHPKDKVQFNEFDEVSKCIYQIPCKNCDKVYVGETGRNLVFERESTRKS